MSDLITDAIVEAATVASINVSLAPYGEAITTTNHLQGGVEALAEMRAALEAAAPLIAAKVLEAVLALHSQHNSYVTYCRADGEMYPCPTVTAIEAALRADS